MGDHYNLVYSFVNSIIMKCSKNLAPLSTLSWLLSLGLALCFISSTEASSTNNTLVSIYNLTLCQFNVSTVSKHFDYVVESALIYPLITHGISHYFLTIAYFLDFAPLLAISAAAFNQGLTILGVIHASMATVAFILFFRRLVLNFLACRFAWTRHTNFVVDARGNVHLNKSPVIMTEPRGAVINNHLVDIKRVVLDGIEAHPVNSVSAEEWAH